MKINENIEKERSPPCNKSARKVTIPLNNPAKVSKFNVQ